MNHLISIIVPVLNRQNEIEACIRSVFAQSYGHWELLIIDNGSTDRTPEICKILAAEDSRVRLLHSERGVSPARNAGLEAAGGKYLFFLDSDDVIHPSLLETLLRAMEEHHAALAGTSRFNIPQQHWEATLEKAKCDQAIGQSHFLTNEKALWAIFRYITPLNIIGGVMMLRSLVAETRFRGDLHIGEDFLFMYENLIKGPDVVFVKNKWYYARIHDSNLSWDYSFEGFRSRFDRRKLVWLSEEALGRIENADLQKDDALDVYIRCLKQNPGKDHIIQMQQVMKAHKKTIFPRLSMKHKLLFTLSVYTPKLYQLVFAKK